MEYKIKLRHPITKAKITFTAYTKETAMNIIEQSIKDGWRVKNTDELKPLFKKLREKKEHKWQIIRNENNEIVERVLVGTNIKIVREYCGSFKSDSYFNILVVNGNDDLTKTTELGSGYTLNMLKKYAEKLAIERGEKEK